MCKIQDILVGYIVKMDFLILDFVFNLWFLQESKIQDILVRLYSENGFFNFEFVFNLCFLQEKL